MTEERREPRDQDELSADERELLERLRQPSGRERVEAVEDQPEMVGAAESDTPLDPDALPSPTPSETDGEERSG